MATEKFYAWYNRVLFEGLLLPPFGPLNLLTLGALNFVQPFRKRANLDLPASIASRSTHWFSFHFKTGKKAFLAAMIHILDTIQTPGGLKVDETAIEKWETELEPKEGDAYIHIYRWNWYSGAILTDEDRCANEDGEYKWIDLLLDIEFTVLGFILAIILIKNAGAITKVLSAAIGKTMKTRKSKRQKKLALATQDKVQDVNTQMVTEFQKIKEQVKRTKILLDDTLVDEVAPSVEEIRKRKNLRL